MKHAILETIWRHAQSRPNQPALIDPNRVLSYRELADTVRSVANNLQAMTSSAIALMAENSLAWAILDLAAMDAGIPVVPIPTFFTPEQARHVIRDAAVDLLLVDRVQRLEAVMGAQLEHFSVDLGAGSKLFGCATGCHDTRHDPSLAKVTYTSGSTGAPKGVCLSYENLEAVCHALQQRTQYSAQDRHLCVLPLSTLLENVAGVYLPLMSGATVFLWPDQERGVVGAAQIDGEQLLPCLQRVEATTAILTPGLLNHLLDAMVRQRQSLPRLRFLAVGGASVSPDLIQRARDHQLPVYEGYGLSECASVVSLNAPGETQQGTGRPLSHVQVVIAADGEVCVRGNVFMGYLNQPPNPVDCLWHTGDIGHLDVQGHLHISGRKKNLIVTDRGRNVSPEWVERTLLEQNEIVQAAVFGDAQPYLIAVITADPTVSNENIEQALARANHDLPDYARVCGWIHSQAPMSQANGQLNAKGDLVRDAIARAYAEAMETIYLQQEPKYGVL